MRAIILCVLFGAGFAWGEGNVGNGGDADIAEFVSLGNVLVRIVQHHSAIFPELDYRNFEDAVRETEVTVAPRTYLRKKEVDGINYPKLKRIKFSRKRWKASGTDLVRKARIVFHEYLGILQKEIGHYKISGRLNQEYLNDLLSPEFTYERKNSLVATICEDFSQPTKNECLVSGYTRIAEDRPVFDIAKFRARWSLETIKELCSIGAPVKRQLNCLQIGVEHFLSTVGMERSSSGGKLDDLEAVIEAFSGNIGKCSEKTSDEEALRSCLADNVLLALVILDQ